MTSGNQHYEKKITCRNQIIHKGGGEGGREGTDNKWNDLSWNGALIGGWNLFVDVSNITCMNLKSGRNFISTSQFEKHVFSQLWCKEKQVAHSRHVGCYHSFCTLHHLLVAVT